MKFDGNWIIGRYAYDVHKHLLSKEEKMKTFLYQSPQLNERVSLVEYMTEICEKMGFCKSVKHMAVYFLDMFMDNHIVIETHLCLIAVGCLIVAVKVDEQEILIPKMSDFNAILGNSYQLREIIEVETAVMEFFNWDLLLPTPATYIEYYSIYVIRLADFEDSYVDVFELKEFALKYVDYFLELTLKDCRFRMFRPSVVAASCIAVAREFLELTPTWPSTLENVTNCKFSMMKNCIDLMLQNAIAEKKSEELLSQKWKSSKNKTERKNSNCQPKRFKITV